MSTRDALLEQVLTQEFHMVRSTICSQPDAVANAHLTMSQFRALLHVAEDSTCTMAEMADAMGVKPNVATGVVQRLVEKDFLERAENPEDRRARLLTLSAAGHEFLHAMMQDVRAQRLAQLMRLSDQQLENFLDILTTLVDDQPLGVHGCAGSEYADAHLALA